MSRNFVTVVSFALCCVVMSAWQLQCVPTPAPTESHEATDAHEAGHAHDATVEPGGEPRLEDGSDGLSERGGEPSGDGGDGGDDDGGERDQPRDAAPVVPKSPRDLPFFSDPAIKSADLSTLRWKFHSSQQLANGVTLVVGTIQAWEWTTYRLDGAKITVPWMQVIYAFFPPGYPNTSAPGYGKAMLYNIHDIALKSGAVADLMSAEAQGRGQYAAQLAKDFGVPVMFHGWDQKVIEKGGSSAFHNHQFPLLLDLMLGKRYPCSVEELGLDGSYILNGHPLTKGDMYAITALQRLAEERKGKIDKVGSIGISKEGWSHWLLAAVDDRVEVAAPGGHYLQDLHALQKAYEENWGCQPRGSATGTTARSLTALMQGLSHWMKETPAGRMADRISNPVHYKDLFYPRLLLISGDLTLPGQHDRFYPLDAENDFLSKLTEVPWRYWRVPDKSGVNVLVESAHGRSLLAAVAETLVYKTALPQIVMEASSDSQRQLTIKVTTQGAVDKVRLYASASANRFWNDQEQVDPNNDERWKIAELTQQSPGVWVLPGGGKTQPVPQGKEAALIAEAVKEYKRGENTYFLSASTMPKMLLRRPKLSCQPYTPPRVCQ